MPAEDIRILIIEDEELWVSAISSALDEFGYSVAGVAMNFEDAVLRINDTNAYDVVLLDIRLNGRNMGIEVGRLINLLYKKPFIFMTATHDLHSFEEITEVQPSAYLPKPVNPSSLIISIQNALNNFDTRSPEISSYPLDEQTDFFFVKHGNKYKKIAWDSVVYLRTVGNYTHIYNSADNTENPVRSSLAKTFGQIIPAAIRGRFVQINRGEVIQASYVTELSGNDIHTKFGIFICTDGCLKEVKNKINIVI